MFLHKENTQSRVFHTADQVTEALANGWREKPFPQPPPVVPSTPVDAETAARKLREEIELLKFKHTSELEAKDQEHAAVVGRFNSQWDELTAKFTSLEREHAALKAAKQPEPPAQEETPKGKAK